MTKKEYQDFVETNFKKPLREVMYELCVLKNVVPIEGAHILGVPKEIFIYWRNDFRFGPDQLRYDQAERIDKRNRNLYRDQLQGVDLTRTFLYKEEKSLEGFKEIIERYLELMKMKKINQSSDGDELQINLKIACLEYTLNLLDSYYSEELYDKYFSDLKQ